MVLLECYLSFCLFDATTRRFIEEIGTYNPCVSPAEIKIDAERAQEWIKTGAQPTDTVRALLKKVNAL